MKPQRGVSLYLVAIGLFALPAARAESPASVATTTSPALVDQAKQVSNANCFVQAFTEASAYINGRYRYEYVDDDGLPKEGKASTVRNRLGFTTSKRLALKGKLEFEDIQEIGNDLYNSTVNGRDDRAVVADADTTEVNEANLSYTIIDQTDLTAGRYALNLDNQRFIGDVDWRQNNQTFDGVMLGIKSIESTELLYAYLSNINRVFGDDSPVGDFDSNSHIFNASFRGLPLGLMTLYSYLLDFDNAPAVSSATVGGRFTNSSRIDPIFQPLYDLEAAYQTDYADNEKSYTANYYRVDLGASSRGFKVLGSFESLGSDNNTGFSTPLATLHRWNGWADKFLTTPQTGLNDASVSLAYTAPECSACWLEKTALTLSYHYFSAETDDHKYGDEWDAQVLQPLSSNFSLGFKLASYSAGPLASDSFAKDTEKLMGWISYNFSTADLART